MSYARAMTTEGMPTGPDPEAITAAILEAYPETDVVEALGARFFSLDPAKHWPNFATIVTTDEHDEGAPSQLFRDGAFRLNLGVGRATFERLVVSATDPDYAAFDTIVMTWTLCSITNPTPVLLEMRRVLQPGGRLLFVEHGLSPEPRIMRWQRWLTPCWKRIGGGCHLDRKMDDLIRSAGFRVDALETRYMPGPKPWTFMYQGTAIK